jgi:dTDP-4-dehydrorhamnose 3,5-epimerase
MEIVKADLPGVAIIIPDKFSDERGFFSETYVRSRYAEAGITEEFVQDNHSFSTEAHVVRGLHFQTEPFAQAKLVRVVRGRIMDVVVDIRRGSPTHGRHLAVEIGAEEWNQIYVPVGFAHGLCTLEPNTEVLYKVSAPYAPRHEAGLAWDDPDLGIAWPVAPEAAILSPKDRNYPRFKDLPHHFSYVQGS